MPSLTANKAHVHAPHTSLGYAPAQTPTSVLAKQARAVAGWAPSPISHQHYHKRRHLHLLLPNTPPPLPHAAARTYSRGRACMRVACMCTACARRPCHFNQSLSPQQARLVPPLTCFHCLENKTKYSPQTPPACHAWRQPRPSVCSSADDPARLCNRVRSALSTCVWCRPGRRARRLMQPHAHPPSCGSDLTRSARATCVCMPSAAAIRPELTPKLIHVTSGLNAATRRLRWPGTVHKSTRF